MRNTVNMAFLAVFIVAVLVAMGAMVMMDDTPARAQENMPPLPPTATPVQPSGCFCFWDGNFHWWPCTLPCPNWGVWVRMVH